MFKDTDLASLINLDHFVIVFRKGKCTTINSCVMFYMNTSQDSIQYHKGFKNSLPSVIIFRFKTMG